MSSYYFYAAWDWRFLGLLIASTVVDYSCARALDRQTDPAWRKRLLWLSITFNLTLLGVFKYFNFFAANLHALFGAIGWQVGWGAYQGAKLGLYRAGAGRLAMRNGCSETSLWPASQAGPGCFT